jgi:5-methylcytosine-specific restriction endonuclease McrA
VDSELVKPHIDDIIAVSKGGADSLENLQPLCETEEGLKVFSLAPGSKATY